MDIFKIRARFSDGDVKFYEVTKFGHCEAMQFVLSHIAENEDKCLDLESLDIFDIILGT